MTFQSTRMAFHSMCSEARRREHRKESTHAALQAWEMTVAMAAPLTPMSSRKINTGSRTIFITAPMMTDVIAIPGLPCVYIKVFRPNDSCTNTVPNR